MLIALSLSSLLGVSTPRAVPLAVAAFAQAVGSGPDVQGPAAGKKPENDKNDQTIKAEKKPKKKKVAKDRGPSPDEPVDPDAPAAAGRGVRFSWKQHPSLRLGDVLRLDFEAKMQEDGHASYGVVSGLNTWEMHRNRFGVQGSLFKKIEFEIEREFTEKELTEKDILLGITSSSHWKDVNVNLAFIKNAQIQIGKFKVPFGLDELTGVTHNDFVYRSLGATHLAPARDIGGMVHGRFFKRGLNYWVGVFQHDGDNARSKKIEGGGRTLAARATGTPFRRLSSSFGNVEIGTSFAISALSDDSFRPNGLRGRTVMTQDTVYDSVYVKGRRRRWGADADYTAGPASLRTEFTWVGDDRIGQGIGDENLPDARARAWYVSGTWALTGEDKKRPLKAAEPFAQGGIGAIELAGRYERMWFDSTPVGQDAPFRNPRAETIYPSGEGVLTIGLNWTLNRFAKIQVNGIREHVEDPQRNPVPNGAAFWSRVIRLQFVL